MNPLPICLAAFAISLTLFTNGQAQIAWQTPGAYTATPADISTNGTFFAAVTENIYNGNNAITVGDTTFDAGSDSHITGLGAGGSDGSGSSDTPYQLALHGVAYTYGDAVTFTLTGLNVNDLYQVEIWNVDPSTTRATQFTSTGAAGTTSVVVNTGFVLGTLSGVTSQAISFQPAQVNGVGEVNAVSLRDLGAAPEPSTYALMLAGLAILGFCVRRKLA